jgi:hypothetical protein
MTSRTPRRAAAWCGAAALALAACGPSSGDRTGRFEGYYLSSFEVSSFVPCGSDRRPGYGAGVWLTWAESVTAPGLTAAPVFVRVEGTLHTGDRAGYGHLAAYSGELTVSRVLTIDRAGRCPDTPP